MTRGMGCLAAVALLVAPAARAHGIWGHVHVTGWAVENMPDDELRAFLLDPEVFNALLFGAVFTDSGYSISEDASRAYSEHTHWEPFVADYVAWIRENDPPPWTSLESRKRVAFLLGCASHGLQDELFDSTFLHVVEERDHEGQDATDPGTDGFLALDGHLRFAPTQDLPMDTLLELYAFDPTITEEVILEAVERTTGFYANEELGWDLAATMGELYADRLPWTREHYLDPDVPGSLRSEIVPTMRYQQAIWARLHDELPADEVVTFAFPEVPRRLRSPDPASAESWVTVVFGAGVRYADGLTDLSDADGAPVSFAQANTQWGATWTRVIRLQPSEALAPGGWYTARLDRGLERIDGLATTAPHEVPFQVACDDATADLCEDVELPVASVDGLPPEAPTDVEPAPAGGCGCAAPGSAASLPGLALGALLARRRRGVFGSPRPAAARTPA